MRFFEQMLLAAVCCGICWLTGCASNGSASAVTSTSPPTNPTSPTDPSIPITTTATAKFVYTGNQGASLSGYSVNTSTGALTALSGFPLTVGANPQIVAVDPQNLFLFVGDIAFDKLHVFAINASTGALTEVAASPYATVREPVALAVDPSGTHVYVASQGSNSVGGFSLSATGALTPITGSPFATSGTQDFGDKVVMNPAGTFVYVQDLANIYTYSVSGESGALTLVQTIAGPSNAIGDAIALDPHGTYLYAVGSTYGVNTKGSISDYSINASTGMLTLAGSSPMTEPNGAYTISISPTGLYAYTIENNNYLVSYALNNGVFTPIGTVFSDILGQKIGIDPSGSFVYVPQTCSVPCSNVNNLANNNVINEFSIGSTGTLTPISGSPVAAGITPWGIAFTTQ